MSVSGVPSIPGFDVLFPSGAAGSSNSAGSGTASSGTSSSAPASYAGSDVLGAPLDTPNVPGFDVLQPASHFPGASSDASGTSSTPATGSTSSSNGSSPASSSAVNPYQQAYNSLETWSANYLMQSVESGAPSGPSGIPELTGGQSAGSFAQLNTLLAQIKPLIAIDGAEQAGTSGNSSNGSTGSTGASVDALA